MKLRKNIIISLGVIGALSFAYNASAQSGANPVSIRSIEHEDVDVPQFSVRADEESLGTQAPNRDWLRLTTQYETSADWTDEIQFTYYVLLKAKSAKDVGKGGKQLNMFKGSVTYQHVEKGKHLSGMFLHPSVFTRYGKVESIGVVITVGGEEVAKDAAPVRKPWWEEHAEMPIPLLNRSETPYGLVDMDKYELIKK